VLTGRPARAILNRFVTAQGPLNRESPSYPLPTQAVLPLRKTAESEGSRDFSPHWSGQARALTREMSAADLTRAIAEEGLALLRRLSAN
jgi:nitronate monooxygenase